MAVIIAVFAAFAYLYSTTAKKLSNQDKARLVEAWAILFAERIGREGAMSSNPGTSIPALRNSAILFQQHYPGVTQIRVYGITVSGPAEVVTYPPASPEPLSAEALSKLKGGSSISRLEASQEDLTIRALAPIQSKSGMIGAVSLKAEFSEDTSLIGELTDVILLLLALAGLSITLPVYLLFKRMVYRPIKDLLAAIRKAESGDLTGYARPRASDEIGLLSMEFNQMLSRIRQMSEERERHNQRLQELVDQATVELAERNKELEAANLQLFEIQRQLTQFERLAAAGQLAAQFAHEVGTPLNLISGHVQVLMSRFEDEKTLERLSVIAAQIERITKIVRHLLDSTRRPKPELAPLDINSLIRRMLDVTSPTLAARNVEVIVDLSANPSLIEADVDQLQQVFINLINNSLEAMPQGGALTISTYNDSMGAVVIECADTGEGISEEIQERIFDPLFTTKSRGQGSGLGLSIVKQIIKEHGGEIEVESKLGQGANFIIKLPTSEQSEDVAAEAGKAIIQNR